MSSRILLTRAVDAPVQPDKFIFDSFNTNFSGHPEYNDLFFRSTEQFLNARLSVRGHLFLNDVLDALGISRTPNGAVTGWTYDFEKRTTVSIDIRQLVDMDDDELRFVGYELTFQTEGVMYDLI